MLGLDGVRYRTMLHELWDKAIDAFRMEQALLRHFDAVRHSRNQEVVSGVAADIFQETWIEYLANHRKRSTRRQGK